MTVPEDLTEKVWVLDNALRPHYANSMYPAYHTREDCPALAGQDKVKRVPLAWVPRGSKLCGHCANAAP